MMGNIPAFGKLFLHSTYRGIWPKIQISKFQCSRIQLECLPSISHFRSASIDAKLHLKNINLLLLVCQLGLHSNTKRTIAVNVFSTYRKPICLSSQSYIAAIIASIGTHAVMYLY